MKPLKYNADVLTPKTGERVLVKPCDIVARRVHGSRRNLFEPGNNHQQTGFPRARRPNQSDGLAAFDDEFDPL